MESQAGTQIVRTVGRNIALARAERDLSQRHVGVALEMDARAVSRWENGRVLPSPVNLAALSKLLGRDVAWFYEPRAREWAALERSLARRRNGNRSDG